MTPCANSRSTEPLGNNVQRILKQGGEGRHSRLLGETGTPNKTAVGREETVM